MKRKQIMAIIISASMSIGITACNGISEKASGTETTPETAVSLETSSGTETAAGISLTDEETRKEIEDTLNLANNREVTWSYDSSSDSWMMSVTCAVTNPELEDYQGVSANVPGAYVEGIDTVRRRTRKPLLPMPLTDTSMWHAETGENRVLQRTKKGKPTIPEMRRFALWIKKMQYGL